mmetsp:Transcript_15566/g.26402  ORF Transcript_15566/g.26402 Transcript_15566/m.26402 type:complete len:332 (-) Transcript_15566:187-1182(-)
MLPLILRGEVGGVDSGVAGHSCPTGEPWRPSEGSNQVPTEGCTCQLLGEAAWFTSGTSSASALSSGGGPSDLERRRPHVAEDAVTCTLASVVSAGPAVSTAVSTASTAASSVLSACFERTLDGASVVSASAEGASTIFVCAKPLSELQLSDSLEAVSIAITASRWTLSCSRWAAAARCSRCSRSSLAALCAARRACLVGTCCQPSSATSLATGVTSSSVCGSASTVSATSGTSRTRALRLAAVATSTTSKAAASCFGGNAFLVPFFFCFGPGPSAISPRSRKRSSSGRSSSCGFSVGRFSRPCFRLRPVAASLRGSLAPSSLIFARRDVTV